MAEKIGNCIKNIFGRIWNDLKNDWICILLFGLWNVVVRKLFGAFCPFLIVTGFPCAGCGMTRAVFYILTGQIRRGMNLNPAAPLWIAWIFWFFWNRYVRGRYKKSTMCWLGAVCVVTLAIYLYRMANAFPGSPPLVYYQKNLLRRFLRKGFLSF